MTKIIYQDSESVTIDMSDSHEVKKVGRWGKKGPMMHIITEKELS